MALLLRWGDLEARARAIVDDDLKLIWSNATADALLDEAVDIRRAGDHVELVRPAEHEIFRRFIVDATPGISGWCTARAGEGALVFRAWRIDTGDMVGVGLAFHTSDAAYTPKWADFGRALGLTPTEYRVALRLLDGVRIETVAEDTGIAPATARTHVRNLYVKLGVGSREALFRALAPFRIA